MTSKFAMKLGSCLFNCFFRFCYFIEITDMNVFAAFAQLSNKLVFSGVPYHSFDASCIVRWPRSVCLILRSRSKTKIGKSIVGSVVIFVINLTIWPTTKRQKPRKPMCVIQSLVHPYNNVFTISCRPRNTVDYDFFASFYLPPQNPGVLIVRQNLCCFFVANH